MPEFTLADVKKHSTAEDCWIVVGKPGEKQVYDVTKFLDEHPGGPEIIMDLAGESKSSMLPAVPRHMFGSHLVGR
jgi:cytochrome b involved in lipid metabolism